MVNRLIGFVTTIRYALPDLRISIPKGHALEDQFIDRLDRKNVVVFFIIHDIVPYLYVLKHELRHIKTIGKCAHRRQDTFLDKLKIAGGNR